MAKFLITSGVSYNVEDIVQKAKAEIILITPFLKFNRNIMIRLLDANKKGVTIIIIFGKDQLQEKQREFLKKLDNLTLYFLKNLHAKCYFNEHKLLISSMNLYEFSEKHNREMGILVERKEDTEIYREAVDEAISIINNSELIQGKRQLPKKSVMTEGEIQFSSHQNFHVPDLLETLKAAYSNKRITIENETIYISELPFEYIGFQVAQTVQIDFDIPMSNFENLKKSFFPKLEKTLRPWRCFWNHKKISIYIPTDYRIEFSEQGKKQRINGICNVIQRSEKLLNDFKDEILR